MSLKPALLILFLHICFGTVVAKLRTNNKNQQRLLLAGSPALDVTIADISVKFNNAKGYDINGCLDPSKVLQSKYYAQVQYEIRNSGDAGFVAPSESVNYAACGTPAILKFLALKIEGGRDVSSNPYPAIELGRFATCVIDDSNTTAAGSCKAGGPTTVFAQKPSQSYGINQGGSYGVSKTVFVKFPLTAEQFNALSNSASAGLTFTLSVNKAISPNGAAGVVAAVDGSKLKEVTTWTATGQGTSVRLFIRPPSAAPTTAPSAAPTAVPSTTPTVAPTTAPSAPPTTTPSNLPTTVPSMTPTVVSSVSPTALPTAAPSNAPSAVPSTAVATSSMICDNIIGPNLGTTTVSGYGNDKTLKRVCLTTEVQSIAHHAFFTSDPFSTSSISSIYIPSTVKTIENAAFQYNKLKNVTFTGDIVSIGDYAFYNQYTTALSVVFPGPVGYIGQNAFFTNRIQTVTFPAGLTYLGQTAFDTNQLTSVTFRGQVTVFGNDVFQNNPNLKTVYYPRSWTTFPKTTKFSNGGAGITFVETD